MPTLVASEIAWEKLKVSQVCTENKASKIYLQDVSRHLVFLTFSQSLLVKSIYENSRKVEKNLIFDKVIAI